VSELRWPRRSVRSNDRCSLTRTDGNRGPNSHRATRAGTPAVQLVHFRVLGPPFCGAERRAGAMGAGGAFKISAPRFRPLDKDDAVPKVRKADEGNAWAAQSVHRTTADEPEQTGCHAGPTIHPRAGTPAPHVIRFPVWARSPGGCATISRNPAQYGYTRRLAANEIVGN
jgi:hypothetical protein